MDSRQSLVASAKISSGLFQRLHEELARDPDASNNLRNIASRALQSGRIEDAWLASLEARAVQEIAKKTTKFK